MFLMVPQGSDDEDEIERRALLKLNSSNSGVDESFGDVCLTYFDTVNDAHLTPFISMYQALLNQVLAKVRRHPRIGKHFSSGGWTLNSVLARVRHLLSQPHPPLAVYQTVLDHVAEVNGQTLVEDSVLDRFDLLSRKAADLEPHSSYQQACIMYCFLREIKLFAPCLSARQKYLSLLNQGSQKINNETLIHTEILIRRNLPRDAQDYEALVQKLAAKKKNKNQLSKAAPRATQTGAAATAATVTRQKVKKANRKCQRCKHTLDHSRKNCSTRCAVCIRAAVAAGSAAAIKPEPQPAFLESEDSTASMASRSTSARTMSAEPAYVKLEPQD